MSYFKSVFKTGCLLKVLSSKRLLVEHLEMLELCVNSDLRVNFLYNCLQSRLAYTVVSCGCLVSALLTYYSRGNRYALALTASAFATCLHTKWIYSLKMNKIDELIKVVEKFEDVMRRNIIFIAELNQCDQNRSSYWRRTMNENEVFANCLQSCKIVIVELHGYVQSIENKTKLYEKFIQWYEPLESLENLGLLREGLSTHYQLKTFYTIFLYVQSACLLRLALACASDADFSHIEVERKQLICAIDRATTKSKKYLLLTNGSEMNQKICYNNDLVPVELLSINQQSMMLSTKLTIAAKQIAEVDGELSEIASTFSGDCKRLRIAEQHVTDIGAGLLVRYDEIQRLIISLRKVLKRVVKIENCCSTQSSDESDQLTNDETQCSGREEANIVEQVGDEFFICHHNEAGKETPVELGPMALYEEEWIDRKLIKHQFGPVLNQLREKLQPIEQSFKLREQQALQLKGLKALPEESGSSGLFKRGYRLEYDESTESSDDEVPQRRAKRYQEYYEKDREFLASKPQINLILNHPINMQHEEKILE
ncbi:uncharacterized protein LOC131213904 [Anopheles bellator]|uniref:uncharacterized protein LOC131213904 n=1 Tax=Anopheles bellator TaxID=139047 RepID=UPI00264979EC|nr:uncharacterized protein LOC131213904 [Anopheles bellator]